MKKLNNLLTLAAGLTGGMLPNIHIPERDWKHSDERLKKAEEKRNRKNDKRRKP